VCITSVLLSSVCQDCVYSAPHWVFILLSEVYLCIVIAYLFCCLECVYHICCAVECVSRLYLFCPPLGICSALGIVFVHG